MADWLPSIGLLSDSSLQGIDEATRNKLQSEATGRFLLGSLLSGRPDIGFQSAIGTANDYTQSQTRLADLEQKKQIRNLAQGYMRPIGVGLEEGSEQEQMLSSQMAGMGAEAGQKTVQALASNQNIPRKFDQRGFFDAVQPLMAAEPTKLSEMLKNIRATPSEPGAVFRDPFSNKITSVNPPRLEAGEEYVYNGRGDIVGLRNLAGKVEAIKERTVAEKGAAAQFEFKPVVENGQEVLRSAAELAGVDKKANLTRAEGDVAGLQRQIAEINKLPSTDATKNQRLAILNQELTKAQEQVKTYGGASPAPVSKLSAPEAAYQQSWEKAEKSARTGYEQSKKNAVALQSLQNIFNRPDFGTNAFTGYKSQIISVLQPLGLSTEQQNRFLTSATSARQALNDFAVNNVSELSGATSDRDIIFGKERFATLQDPTAATRYAIDLLEATNNRKKAYFDFVQNNRTNDVEQKWSQSPEGSASIFETPKMRQYLPSSVVKDGEYKGQTAYLLPNGDVKVFPK